MNRLILLTMFIVATVAVTISGCGSKGRGAPISLPAIQEIVGNIETYAEGGPPEVCARAKEIAAFARRMKEEGELRSRPVEVSRASRGDMTTVVGRWERTYKLTVDPYQPGSGTVAVTIDSGSDRSSFLLGVGQDKGIDSAFKPENLEATLKDPSKLKKLSVLAPDKDGYSPAQSFSDLYRLLSTQEQLEVIEENGDTVLRARTPEVKLEFKVDAAIHLISCDFVQP